MAERSNFFDDIAGVAGGAFSAIAGIGEEMGALVRARVDEALASLSLVRRDEFEAVSALAANARDAQEAADLRIAKLEALVAGLATAGTPADDTPVTGDEPASTIRSATELPPTADEHHHAGSGAPGGPPPRGSTAPDVPPASAI